MERRDYRKDLRRNFRMRQGFFERVSLNTLLILINVIVFILVIILKFFVNEEVLVMWLAVNPSLFLQGFVWTLLTSMFVHANFSHLFLNMISMFFVGGFVERLIGRKRYFRFYFISGIVAGLFFVGLAYLGQFISNGEAIFGGFSTFAVGASGALFGLGGLLAVLIPRLKVLVFFIIPMPMWLAMVVLMFGLWIISIVQGWPIGNTAHFGGLIVGVIYGFYLRNKYARKVRMLNRMFG